MGNQPTAVRAGGDAATDPPEFTVGPASTPGTRASHTAQVPLQVGRIATQCAVRAQLDHDPSVAAHRLTPTAMADVRAGSNRALDADVLAAIGVGEPATGRDFTTTGAPASGADAGPSRPPRVTVIPPGSPADIQSATVHAMATNAQVIVGGWLPPDVVGRRTGRPDLLVRTGVAHHPGSVPGWVPVNVRNHGLTRPEPGSTITASALRRPDPAHAEALVDRGFKAKRLLEDGIELAHHWRLLQAAGLVTSGQPATGGVIDRTGTLWWIDLDAPRWNVDWTAECVSTLARYDHEFELRVELIANQLARNRHEPTAPRRAPVHIGECASCPWDGVCRIELEAADHTSLLPRTTYRHYVSHRDRGIETRAQVAALHWPTAHVLHGPSPRDPEGDLRGFLAIAAHHPATTAVTDIAGHEFNAVVTRLLDIGINTVGELGRIHPGTASYQGAAAGHLPTVIDQARATTAGVTSRARGLPRVAVRRADVEVDVDMENVDLGVYLWGTLVTGRSDVLERAGARAGYQPFFSWEPMGPHEQAKVFNRFWTWLSALRQRCALAGLTFGAYCYTSAEFSKMTQILKEAPDGALVPERTAIDELVTSPDWVDLYDVVRTSLVTGHGLGLKRIAPLAGFSWRDEDPGGLQSMLWHQIAVSDPDPAARAEHRSRLLAYNEDDVLATLAVRRWLDRVELPAIESWSPPEPPPL
ncbi:MAG: TM0106 family RecB-like putative nuclease [Aquihabitans sp.]